MPRKKRVLSGLGAAKKRRRKKAKRKPAKGRRVSRAAAQVKSGPKKGKLKPGCRYLKGDGAMCSGSTRKRKTKRKGRKKASKRTAKKVHAYKLTSTLPYKKKKSKTGKKRLKKGCGKRTAGKYKGMIVCRRKMSRRKAA